MAGLGVVAGHLRGRRADKREHAQKVHESLHPGGGQRPATAAEKAAGNTAPKPRRKTPDPRTPLGNPSTSGVPLSRSLGQNQR